MLPAPFSHPPTHLPQDIAVACIPATQPTRHHTLNGTGCPSATPQKTEDWPYREEAAQVARSLAALPSDVLVDPRDVPESARRALVSLSTESPVFPA